MLNFLIYNFTNVGSIIEFVLISLLLIALSVLIIIFSKKIILSIIISSLSAASILALGLLGNEAGNISPLFYVFLSIISIILVIVLFINLGTARKIFVFRNPNAPKAKKGKEEATKIINRDEIYDIIDRTVNVLSRSKTGAIITFQRNDDLKYLMKNGVNLDCKVNQELLQTIFYPGTRLHDGAVIIKDDKIIAASVYYTLTTKPLNGKYGSRHRAAIGISEVSDSITVVVSEETGRVSIAAAGGIEAVPLDNFKRIFSDAMEND